MRDSPPLGAAAVADVRRYLPILVGLVLLAGATPATAAPLASGPTLAGADPGSPTEVAVTVANASGAAAARSHGSLVARDDDRLLIATDAAIDAIAAEPGVTRVARPRRPFPTAISEGVEAVNATSVKADGITGEGVDVGVIDSGFDVDHPEIRDAVADHTSFAGGIEEGGVEHGTQAAELVNDVAPDADLYLANIDSSIGYGDAVDWMESQGVDVVTMSLTFYGTPGDGTGDVSQTAEEAAENGVVVLAAAGNAANRHFQRPFEDGDGDGWMEWSGGQEFNVPLARDGDPTISGPFDAVLTWNDWPQSTNDYDLYLIDDATGDVVASSESPQSGSFPPVERIRVGDLPAGEYRIQVENYDASGAHTMELYTPSHDLSIADPESSMGAPAVARSAITTGAFDVGTGILEDFSSRGPTNDGRRGLDVIAPDGVSTAAGSGPFYGTSAATPHVAGVAALVRDVAPSATVDETAAAINDTARDLGPSGPDTETGHGKVDAWRAVQRLRSGVGPSAAFTYSPTAPRVGDTVTFDGRASTAGDAPIRRYRWRFGDGTTASGAVVSHAYASGGSYRATLTVTDGTGATSGTSSTVVVSPATAPTIDVRSTGPTAAGNLTLTVDATRTGSIRIDGIPRNWSVLDAANDGAIVAPDGSGDRVNSDGKVLWAWFDDRPNVSVALTLDVGAGAPSDSVDLAIMAENGTTGAQSNVTHTVALADDAVDRYDTDGDGIDTAELQAAIQDFLDGQLDTAGIQAVIQAFLSS